MADKKKSDIPANDTNAKDFLQVFKRGVQFTEELLQENERLRIRLIRLEEENRALAAKKVDPKNYKELMEQLKVLGEERINLLERFRAIENESRDFKERYKEIEEENNRLANLYIASYQLHSSLDLKEVVRITFEIIINLVGSMEFALYFLEGNKLLPVKVQGTHISDLPQITVGKGSAGRAARDKVLYVSGQELTKTSLTDPKACIPLVIGDDLLGMIVVFSFLAQKPCITELDRELFNLLGQHAATALRSARLEAEAQGKVFNASSYGEFLND